MKADRSRIVAATARLDPGVKLVLLHGYDPSATRDLADRMVRQFASGTDPLSVEVVAAASLDKDPQALAAAATAISMFGDRTVIRVDGADEDTLAAVAAVLDGPGGNPVIMIAGGLKKTSKLLLRVEGDAAALAYQAPEARPGDVAGLVEEAGREIGAVPGRGAARALFDACGQDRAVLRRELEKLALYLDGTPAEPKTFELADLAAVGADLGDAELGDLVAGVAGGDAAAADLHLTRLTAQNVAAIMIVRAVQRRFFTLLDLRAAVDGGASPRSAVEGARPPVFWKEKDALTAELSKWRTPMLRAALARLLGVERAIKRSGSAGEVLASQALLGLATQASGRR